MKNMAKRVWRMTPWLLLGALLWPFMLEILGILAFRNGLSSRVSIMIALVILLVPSYVFLLRALQLEIRSLTVQHTSRRRKLARLLVIGLISCWLILFVLYGVVESWFVLGGGLNED